MNPGRMTYPLRHQSWPRVACLGRFSRSSHGRISGGKSSHSSANTSMVLSMSASRPRLIEVVSVGLVRVAPGGVSPFSHHVDAGLLVVHQTQQSTSPLSTAVFDQQAV